jgi:hypothetical protein
MARHEHPRVAALGVQHHCREWELSKALYRSRTRRSRKIDCKGKNVDVIDV